MAITVEHGKLSTLAELDQLRREEEEARRQEELRRESIRYAQKLRQQQESFDAQLALDQYKFNKELEYRKYQVDLNYQAEQEADAWELEKMRLRSQLDFEREERKRQEKIQMFDNHVESIQQSDIYSPEEKERAVFMAKSKFLGFNAPYSVEHDPVAMRAQFLQEKKRQFQEADLRQAYDAVESRIQADKKSGRITPQQAEEQMLTLRTQRQAGVSPGKESLYAGGSLPGRSDAIDQMMRQVLQTTPKEQVKDLRLEDQVVYLKEKREQLGIHEVYGEEDGSIYVSVIPNKGTVPLVGKVIGFNENGEPLIKAISPTIPEPKRQRTSSVKQHPDLFMGGGF